VADPVEPDRIGVGTAVGPAREQVRRIRERCGRRLCDVAVKCRIAQIVKNEWCILCAQRDERRPLADQRGPSA